MPICHNIADSSVTATHDTDCAEFVMELRSLVLCIYVILTSAIPQIAYTFNAQVPQIAQPGVKYHFTISPTTFRPGDGELNYKLEEAPPWLQINTSTGTLSGVPKPDDVGPVSFFIVAADNTGRAPMPATLIVAVLTRPQVGRGVSESLTRAGTRSGPASLLFPPKTAFDVDLSQGVFIPTPQTVYYATMNDHTPLPAWIKFDSSSLRITGTTPSIENQPQLAAVDIVATDIPGFASVKVSFSILVSHHSFLFGAVEENINIPLGEPVNITGLRNQLYLDGYLVSDDDLTSATATTPDWLQFDPRSLRIFGNPPNVSDANGTQNITIMASDRYGDTTTLLVRLKLNSSQLYRGQVGRLNATIGKVFSYRLKPQDLLREDLIALVQFNPRVDWLKYDDQSRTISGTVPWNLAPQVIVGNLTVMTKEQDMRYTQDFEINIVSAHGGTNASSNTTTARRLSRKVVGIIISVTIGSVLIIAALIVAMLYCRKRREQDSKQQLQRRRSIFKRMISKPSAQRTMDTDIWTADEAPSHPQTGQRGPETAPVMPELKFSPSKIDHSPMPQVNSERFSRIRNLGQSSPARSRISIQSSKKQSPRATWSWGCGVSQHYAPGVVNALGLVAANEYSQRVSASSLNPEVAVGTRQDSRVSSISAHQETEATIAGASLYERTPYLDGQSMTQSVNTDILLDGLDESDEFPPGLNHIEAGLHAETSAPTSRLGHSRRIERTVDSRPVPRRGPLHSSFFAGNSGSRRQSTASRFAVYGLGLSPIDGSPDIDPTEGEKSAITGIGKKRPHSIQSLRREGAQSIKDWETATWTSAGSLPSIEPAGPQGWRRLLRLSHKESDMETQSAGKNKEVRQCDSDGQQQSGSSSLYSFTPIQEKGLTKEMENSPPLYLVGNGKAKMSIMERGRSAYRLGTREGRTKSDLKDKSNLTTEQAMLYKQVLTGEKAKRPVTVTGHQFSGIRSKRGDRGIFMGSEAFL